jgi:insertion element IS1 protein InsB
MVVREACPACASQQFKKNGHMHTGQQNHRGKDCGRQCVMHAANRVIDTDQRTLVERLLLEKISLPGICRAVGVSIRWLMDFMVACFQGAPTHLQVQPAGRPREVVLRHLEAEADEMCSFVQQKANKPWV